ncbi:MAG: DAK2 domain-containing protein [Clostridia bacterium]|nr:DAK2 domain-containing protein [Clostridia bacterium]
MKTKQINGEVLKKMFIQGNSLLYMNRDVIDSLNVFPVPDGDTGTNMALTFESAVNEIWKIKNPSISNISKSAAKGSLMGARGNSGVILSQILRGFEKGCRKKKILTKVDFANALTEASNTAYKAVMKPIEGTILTIIREASEKAVELSNQDIDLSDFFYEIILHIESVLDRTPQMLDVLKQAGVVDAGGKGLVFILRGFWEVLSGKKLVKLEEWKPNEAAHIQGLTHDNIEFGYCTEFMVQGNKLNTEKLKTKIKGFGDSLLVVGDDDLIKVHIHTNNPGKVIEYGLNMGELIDVKIDNMRHQHSHIVMADEIVEKDFKKYGFISIAMGEGLSNIFKDLNVDKVIEGGQTMNPSTEDILKAIDDINAENIFILPNNSNIILTANQAKKLSRKNVIVIPSKDVPQGIASMLQFNSNSSIEENEGNMINVLGSVKTVQVTYSVRDSKFNGLEINKDDIIGICDGDIVMVGNDISSVAIDTLKETITDDHEILTIYYGDEISEDAANQISSLVEEEYPDLDVELYYGGQPLYYYIFSIE